VTVKHNKQMKAAAQRVVALLHRIREVSVSNIGLAISYPE
jgi:hypothetical protein